SRVGASLTGSTVRRNDVAAMSLSQVESSTTSMLIWVEPYWFGAGVTTTVRLAPLPVMTMLFQGTSVALSLKPCTLRRSGGVSTSSTVKGRGGVAVSSRMV